MFACWILMCLSLWSRPPFKPHQWNAQHYLRYICPRDIYSTRIATPDHQFPSPTKEHIIPKRWLKTEPLMIHHPQNIFVCTSLTNSHRSSLPFRNITDDYQDHHQRFKIIDGRSGLPATIMRDPHNECVITRTAFCPPVHARGPIARTCMHMLDLYPFLPIHRHVLDAQTMKRWHEEYPVLDWEIDRQLRIKSWLSVPINPHVIPKKR